MVGGQTVDVESEGQEISDVYKRQKRRYYENNRYFTIYTPDQVLRYEIFSWYEANADDMVYQVGFWPDGFFLTFVEEMAVSYTHLGHSSRG